MSHSRARTSSKYLAKKQRFEANEQEVPHKGPRGGHQLTEPANGSTGPLVPRDSTGHGGRFRQTTIAPFEQLGKPPRPAPSPSTNFGRPQRAEVHQVVPVAQRPHGGLGQLAHGGLQPAAQA